jgi:hypothetical protein
MIKEIVRLFWLMVPASRVAKDLGMNPKTILSYYTKLISNADLFVFFISIAN